VVLVLHQLEARKPTNTGLVAVRCLANSAVVYRGRPPAEAEGQPVESWPPGVQPLLLYPDEEAAPIDAWRNAPGPLVLIVPDGTWRQAARARVRLPPLGLGGAIPCVALPEARAAGRRLRTPARPERLATLEAIALALGILEGPDVETALMHVFRVMTERTLWTNGRLAAGAVTGGIPEGAKPHDPLGLLGRRTS
jgi:DTW domain-containing protein YfiP